MRRGLPTLAALLVIALGLAAWGWWEQRGGAGEHTTATTTAALTPSAELPGDPLTVMTANVRISSPEDGVNAWANRREFLVKTLLKQNPDVIGCQEVTPTQGAYLIKELANWYTHYPRAGVGKMEGQSGSGTNRLIGEVTATFASLNTLFYRTDRFEQVDGIAGLAVPEEPQAVPSENTFFTLAVLKEKQSGAMFIVVDTHLRYEKEFLLKCIGRIRGNIAAMLEKYPHSEIILMGDMNHDRTSEAYRALVGGEAGSEALPMPDTLGVLKDCFDYSSKPVNETWGSWHAFTGRSGREWPTDLIFISAGYESLGAKIIRDHDENGHFPSDHFFTLAQLQRVAAGGGAGGG